MYLEKKLGEEITEDSHILEQIGLQFSFNPPDEDDPDYNKVHNWLVEYEEKQYRNVYGYDEGSISISVSVVRVFGTAGVPR